MPRGCTGSRARSSRSAKSRRRSSRWSTSEAIMVIKDAGGDAIQVLTRKDFISDQEVRWCPGCGDYSILAQTQRVMPDLGIPREKIVFISGIGCSRPLPYYMNTYGFPSLHGPPPTIA